MANNYKKSKEIATDSNYLKCPALLVALHFTLETTSCMRIIILEYWNSSLKTFPCPAV